jgi:hypothetical protein
MAVRALCEQREVRKAGGLHARHLAYAILCEVDEFHAFDDGRERGRSPLGAERGGRGRRTDDLRTAVKL